MMYFQPLISQSGSVLGWFTVIFLLFLWLLTLLLFVRYRNRSNKTMHKLKGRLAVKSHHTAKAMLDREEKFKKIIAHMNEGLILTDEDHRIIFANHCSCSILKTSQEALIGKKMEDLSVGASDAGKITRIMELKKTGCTAREEVCLVKGNNELFWASLSVSYPSDLKEMTGGAIIVIVDVTHHINLESKLQKLTSSLVRKVKQLNCLFEVQQILSESDIQREDMLNRLIDVIPRGLMYEGDMRVEIALSGKKFTASNYRETKWCFQTPVKVKGVKAGHLSVSYIGPEPPRQQQPFRVGEKVLIKNIAEKISLVL